MQEKNQKSSGSETLAYLKEKIEKETKFKEQNLELRQKELELQERRLQIALDEQNQLLTNLMAQNNQFLAVISSVSGKKWTLGKETSSFVFYILLTLNSSCRFSLFNNSEAVAERWSLQTGKILGKYG